VGFIIQHLSRNARQSQTQANTSGTGACVSSFAPTKPKRKLENASLLTIDTFLNWSLGIAPHRSACQGTERSAPAAKPSPELPPAG